MNNESSGVSFSFETNELSVSTFVCEKFFKYSAAALGGYGKEENKSFEDKIMRNVLKEVTLDKQMKLE